MNLSSRLKSIRDILMLNTSFTDNLGLLNGKMGIAICFFYVARLNKNSIYKEYASELIEEITEEINDSTTFNFVNGLAGIGYGIEYLIQNSFIDADSDDVLEDLDHSLFQKLMFNPPENISILNGLIGMGIYFFMRVKSIGANDNNISTLKNKNALIHIIDELDIRTQNIDKIIKEPQIDVDVLNFNIIWDYPILIYFLAELYQLNVFNFKVEKILSRLIVPLLSKSNWPLLQSNQLLLGISFNKLYKCTVQKIPNQNKEYLLLKDTLLEDFKKNSILAHNIFENENCTALFENISVKLISNLNRDVIKLELSPNNVSIKQGASGVAWLYQILYELTENTTNLKEAKYWNQLSFSFEEGRNEYAGFSLENPNSYLGFLEGLAGVFWVSNLNKT